MATSKDNNEGVTLLAGGNPQIAKGDGDEPVRAYLAAMPEWKGEIGQHVDRLVRAVVPDVQTAVRWNSPFYGVADGGWFLSMHCFTKYVKVTWLNGAGLEPPPRGTSKDKSVRYSDLAEGVPLDDEQLREWIQQAAALPGNPLF